MSDKKAGHKENLTWKINYLAAQVGEKTHMKKAVVAASRAKYQKIHSESASQLDPETLKQELNNARKLKIEHKLYQARKDVKNALKKAKTVEIQKENKKIKAAQSSLEKKTENDNTEDNKKQVKPVTKEDLEQYKKELEVIKNIDLDLLVNKTIKNKLEKNAALKHEEIMTDILNSLNTTKIEDTTTQNIASRLMANKLVIQEANELIATILNILKGNHEKIEKRKIEEEKKKKEEEKKRKKEEEKKKAVVPNKKPRISSSSEFMETLGGGSVSDDEVEDEKFQEIYEGAKKPNRVGQRQRRKQWEEMYGREANHVAAEFKKREEKRLQNPDYKPKKKPTPKPAVVKSSAPAEPVHPSWEAKRIQEEIMSKALSGKGASNNKIVFDDSD